MSLQELAFWAVVVLGSKSFPFLNLCARLQGEMYDKGKKKLFKKLFEKVPRKSIFALTYKCNAL